MLLYDISLNHCCIHGELVLKLECSLNRDYVNSSISGQAVVLAVEWLLFQVKKRGKRKVIGVLDIYGFEIFKVSSGIS